MDKVVHFEIPFDDKNRAMKFYADAFGWKLTDMAEMDYVMAETTPMGENRMPAEPGAIKGGLFQRPKEEPHTVIYVGVQSIDASLNKAQAAGGRRKPPSRHGRVCLRGRPRGQRPGAVRNRVAWPRAGEAKP